MNEKTPPKPQTVAVRRLVLRDKINLPIGGVTDVLLGDEKAQNKPRYLIEYVPSMRHHRVAYFAAGDKEPKQVLMIGEGAVAFWEPQT